VIVRNNLINKFWHSDSRLVFNNKRERVVIGRLSEGGYEIKPLTEEDIELCNSYRFKIEEISTSTKLMSLLDENKEEIPDGVYLQMANLLKEQHTEEEEKKEERKSEYVFVEIEYYYPEAEESNDEAFYDIRIRKESEIVRMERVMYNRYLDGIRDNINPKIKELIKREKEPKTLRVHQDEDGNHSESNIGTNGHIHIIRYEIVNEE